MSICMHHDLSTGTVRPEILCDNCRKPIADVRMAVVAWKRELMSIQTLGIFVCHKRFDGCSVDDLERKTHPDDAFPWMEMADFFAWLLWNKAGGEKKPRARPDGSDYLVLEVRTPL